MRLQSRHELSFILRDIKLVCFSISHSVCEMKVNWANIYLVSSESKSLETMPLNTFQCYKLCYCVIHVYVASGTVKFSLFLH